MTWWALFLGCGATADPVAGDAPPAEPVQQVEPAARRRRRSPEPLARTVDVWFIDAARLEAGGDALVPRSAKVEPGTREEVAQAVVDAVFAGPDEEGLLTLAQGATGGRVQLDGRVATVVLEGPCQGAGAPNVHDQLGKSLRGLEGIAFVRTVDPGGPVPPPDVRDHRAECLAP